MDGSVVSEATALASRQTQLPNKYAPFKDRANELLPEMLPRFVKPGCDLCSDAYEIRTILDGVEGIVHLYVEGERSFLLCERMLPIAIVGFDVRSRLTIVQLQGVKRRRKHLASFRWQQLLVELVAAVVDRHETIHILPAAQVDWYQRPLGIHLMSSEELVKHQERLSTHYDGTARSLGFRYDPDLKLWQRARQIE